MILLCFNDVSIMFTQTGVVNYMTTIYNTVYIVPII